MLRRLAQIELLVASLLLGIIVVLVFAAAIMRFFGHPLIWSVDMAQLLFIWLCFFGATRAMREKGHLGIDILVRHLAPALRLRLEIILTLLVLVFLGLLAYEGYRLTMLNRQRLFGDSGLSYAWVTASVPIGCLMIGAALVNNLLRALTAARGGTVQFVYSRVDGDAQPASEL